MCIFTFTIYIYIYTYIDIYSFFSIYIYLLKQTLVRDHCGLQPQMMVFGALRPLALERGATVVGNGLLQFTLLMCAAQAYKCNIALLEHPPASSTRYDQLPPSIWRLKATKLLLLHPGVQLHLVQQGFYGGASPKPTTVMIAKRHQ